MAVLRLVASLACLKCLTAASGERNDFQALRRIVFREILSSTPRQ